MKDGKLNKPLSRFHNVMAIFYLVGTVAVGLIWTVTESEGFYTSWLGFQFVLVLLCVMTAHRVAAVGARDGKQWGKVLSGIIGFLLLFSFPVGTIMGVFVFFQIGSKWQTAAQQENIAVTKQQAPQADS